MIDLDSPPQGLRIHIYIYIYIYIYAQNDNEMNEKLCLKVHSLRRKKCCVFGLSHMEKLLTHEML
ncbi:hypothetical protein ACMBCM_04885, partial [Spiroplasma sp. K1]